MAADNRIHVPALSEPDRLLIAADAMRGTENRYNAGNNPELQALLKQYIVSEGKRAFYSRVQNIVTNGGDTTSYDTRLERNMRSGGAADTGLLEQAQAQAIHHANFLHMDIREQIGREPTANELKTNLTRAIANNERVTALYIKTSQETIDAGRAYDSQAPDAPLHTARRNLANMGAATLIDSNTAPAAPGSLGDLLRSIKLPQPELGNLNPGTPPASNAPAPRRR